jgi:hypothetical protein
LPVPGEDFVGLTLLIQCSLHYYIYC